MHADLPDHGLQASLNRVARIMRVAGLQGVSRRRGVMGSVGDAYDNAMAESFFASLECELLDRRVFRTQVDARMEVFRYIEGWYNPRRRHSALGYLSPVRFEAAHRAALQPTLAHPAHSPHPSSPGGSELYSTAPRRSPLTPRVEGEQGITVL